MATVSESHLNAESSFLTGQESQNRILSWIFSTDHKRIGLLYLASILIFFITGVMIGFLLRLELIAPGKTIVGAGTYNSLFKIGRAHV